MLGESPEARAMPGYTTVLEMLVLVRCGLISFTCVVYLFYLRDLDTEAVTHQEEIKTNNLSKNLLVT